MTQNNEKRNINPDAAKVQVGARTIREIIIYPLSISDQMQLTDKFSEIVQKFSEFDSNKMTNEDAIKFFKDFLSDNLPEFMEFVVNPNENAVPTLDEVTNKQLAEIAENVFRINYEDMIKNFKDLFKRAQEAMNQEQ